MVCLIVTMYTVSVKIVVANEVREKQKKFHWKGSSQGELSSYPESYFAFLVEPPKLWQSSHDYAIAKMPQSFDLFCFCDSPYFDCWQCVGILTITFSVA